MHIEDMEGVDGIDGTGVGSMKRSVLELESSQDVGDNEGNTSTTATAAAAAAAAAIGAIGDAGGAVSAAAAAAIGDVYVSKRLRMNSGSSIMNSNNHNNNSNNNNTSYNNNMNDDGPSMLSSSMATSKESSPETRSLIKAIKQGRVDNVRQLINASKHPDGVNLRLDDEGHTCLAWSAATGDVDVVRVLAEELHADTRLSNDQGETPLHRAVLHSYSYQQDSFKEILTILKDSVDTPDNRGSRLTQVIAFRLSPKHDPEAALYYLKVLVAEVEAGRIDINVNHQDNDGDTALGVAVEHGPAEAIRLLLHIGADVTLANNDGDTALKFANPVFKPMLKKAALMAAEEKRIFRSCRNLWFQDGEIFNVSANTSSGSNVGRPRNSSPDGSLSLSLLRSENVDLKSHIRELQKEKKKYVDDIAKMEAVSDELRGRIAKHLMCQGCGVKRRDTMLLGCGHWIFCRSCFEDCMVLSGVCPVCTLPITGTVHSKWINCDEAKQPGDK